MTTTGRAPSTWRGSRSGAARSRACSRRRGRSSSTSASTPSESLGRHGRRAGHSPVLQLQNTLHWVKSIAIDRDAVGRGSRLERDVAVGHYKPINSPRFVNDCHEFIFHFTPVGRHPARSPGPRRALPGRVERRRGGKRAGGGTRCRGNTWFLPYETIQSRDRERPHPATFPVRLPEYCLRLHGLSRIERVLDPFLGLGPHGRRVRASSGSPATAIEIDPHYLDEAVAPRPERDDGAAAGSGRCDSVMRLTIRSVELPNHAPREPWLPAPEGARSHETAPLASAALRGRRFCVDGGPGTGAPAASPPPPPPPSHGEGRRRGAGLHAPYLVAKTGGGFERRLVSLSDFTRQAERRARVLPCRVLAWLNERDVPVPGQRQRSSPRRTR